MGNIPSAKSLFQEALRCHPNADVNALHRETFRLMMYYREKYYEFELDTFFSRFDLQFVPREIRKKLKEKLLEPVKVKGKEYSNIMEEVSRRVSQSFQPLSGKLAELCVEMELQRMNLQKDVHFTIRKERTDIIVYSPDIHSARAKHRVEVKNVSIRERATRGLTFDGDSLFGFFNQPEEFTSGNVKILNNLRVLNSCNSRAIPMSQPSDG